MERSCGIAPAPEDASRRLQITATDDVVGVRLDRALATLFPELSRARVQKLLREGRVSVDGQPAAKASQPVEEGQSLAIDVPPEPPPEQVLPHPLDLDIVHEDDDLVVVNKPPGLVVHPGAGVTEPTLVSGLLHRYGEELSRLGGDDRRGIVHRLDKGTSGVMLVARNDAAHRKLSDQFAARTVEKEYVAVVYGCPDEQAGVIDVPLGRDRSDRTKMSPDTSRPRAARSRWELDEDLAGFAILRLYPESGRMHQVRAHLLAIHHPCLGDPKYGGAQWRGIETRWLRDALRRFARPALHARRIRIDHPGGERMEFSAPLPADLEALIADLRRHRDEG